MGGYENFYGGADYGLDPSYEGSDTKAYMPAGQFGVTTDARSANQLKEVSRMLNTGAKVIEMGSISADVFESIPQEHFKEIAKLRNLVGAEMTVHAPVLEPTGYGQRGWDASQRAQVERQLKNVVDRAHDLNEEGNVVVTFHSSAALPEGVTRSIVDGKEKVTEIIGINERTGEAIRKETKPGFLEGEKEKPEDYLEDKNKELWSESLRQVNFGVNQGSEALETIHEKIMEKFPDKKGQEIEKDLFKTYNEYVKGENLKEIESIPKTIPVEGLIRNIEHGEIYLRNAYESMKGLFDTAYHAASDEDKKILEAYKKEAKPIIDAYAKDHSKVADFADMVRKGIHTLHRITTPRVYKPLNEFMLDKSSETFSNLAMESFKVAKGDPNKAPIISIENPPAGGGLSTGEGLRDLIKMTRKKFEKKLMAEGRSKSEAEEASEKLIGATWDVGHINMLRKAGYGEKKILEETGKITPFVKHVHLSDNFGMEHTELPMGMGNVPKGILNDIAKKGKDIKKVIETIQWYQHFQASPLPMMFSHYNSPIYAADGGGSWNEQGMGRMGTYFSGYGMNPDFHHQVYGASFTGLPVELGGQMSGRSRVSGTPMD
ncbi:MAG: hypothetical protein MUF61_02300 [archaeon]|jgi:sugar phosphate isomerase/epimerase|nr:hypothetical protein [archaeon]